MKYAKRIEQLKASEIREILKVTQNPDIISFAGGLPAPELFPIDAIREAQDLVLSECGEEALQYTTTEGNDSLRNWIANRMNAQFQTQFTKENIMITDFMRED